MSKTLQRCVGSSKDNDTRIKKVEMQPSLHDNTGSRRKSELLDVTAPKREGTTQPRGCQIAGSQTGFEPEQN